MTARDYVREVELALGDLPWRQRRDLVAELQEHLAELPSEADVWQELGRPAQYAADMRAAAGLERRHGLAAFFRARRPRTLIVVALGLTLLGLAIGATVWIDSYQPLDFQNGVSNLPNGGLSLLGIDGEAVPFRRGKRFDLGLEVANTGPFSVRVLGVPYDSFDPWTAHLMMASVRLTGGPYTTRLTRFHPFDLHPGQHAYLLLAGVWSCHSGMTAGGALTIADFPVRYSFLWRRATAKIALPEGPLAVQFRQGCASGGPTP